MADDLQLALQIKTELQKARKDLADLRGDVKKLGDTRRDIKQLSDTVNHLGSRLGSTGALLRRTFGALGIGLSIRAIVQESVRAEQALAQVEARIKSTGGAAGFTAPQLAAHAAALQKITTTGDEAILEMQSLLLTFTQVQGPTFQRATELVLDMSTAMGQDLKSSTIQLGKALNDPLQGLTALSRVGVRFTQEQETMIKNFVRTGNVAAAQKLILDELQTEFGGAARAARDTFGGALAALRNAFGDLLENKGGMKDATAAVNDLTDKLQDPETVAAVDNITTVVIKGLGKLAEFTAAVHFLIKGPTDDIGKLDAEIDKLDRKIELRQKALQDPRAVRGTGFGGGQFSTGLFASDEAINQQLAELTTERERLIKKLDELQRKRGEEILKSRGIGVVPKVAPPTPVATPVEPALVEAGLRAQRQLIKDEVERQGAELERLLQRNLVSYRDYYAQRAELQRGAIDQEIRATETALSAQRGALQNDPTVTAEQRISGLAKIKELETQLIILRRQRADVGVRADHEEQQSTLQLLDSMDQVRERLATAQGQTAGARRSALEREFRDLVARLEAEGDTAGIAIVERLINTEVAKTRLDEFRQVYDQALQEMQATEADITAQRESGLIGEIEARRRIVELHKATNARLAETIPKMREAAAAAGPEAQRQVEQLADSWRRLGQEIDPIAQRLNASIEQGLANGIEGFINQTRTAKEAFNDFANSVIQALQRIAAEQLAQQIFSGFNLGAIGSFFGGLFGAPVQHRGGVAGAAGGTSRAVSPLAFIGARRLHAGNLGLKKDEYPAILQEGEGVFSRDQMKALGGAGAGKVSVVVENRGQPIKATDTKVDLDGEAMIVKIITDDFARGGPISNTVARTFKLRRG
jgi:hypothetical protein